MDQDVELKVKVSVQEAENNLDHLNKKLDETEQKVDDLNDTVEDGAGAVSGLGNAFENALNEATKGAGPLGGSLRNIFRAVKNAIPVIKQANSAAIAGLTGIKAAIASTGIGLIVVALGEIVAHWKEITKWLGIAKTEQDVYTTSVENTNAALEAGREVMDHQARLMKARGEDEITIIKYKIQQNQLALQNIQLEGEAAIAAAKNRREREKIREEYRKIWETQKKILDRSKQDLEVAEVAAETERKRREEKEKASKIKVTKVKTEVEEDTKPIDTWAEHIKDVLKNTQSDVQSFLLAVGNDVNNEFINLDEEAQNYFYNLIQPESLKRPTEEVISYIERINQAIEKLPDSSSLKGSKFSITGGIIDQLLGGEEESAVLKLEGQLEELETALLSGEESLTSYLGKQYDLQEKALEREKEWFKRRKELYHRYGVLGITDEELDDEAKLVTAKLTGTLLKLRRQFAESILESQENLAQNWIEDLLEKPTLELGTYMQVQERQLTNLQTYYKSMMSTYQEGSKEYQNYAREYEKVTETLNGTDGKRSQIVAGYLQQQLGYWQEFLGGLTSILSSIADIEEERIRREVKSGKISEEQAEKEFQRVKNLQIAETIINTISGAIGAYLQAAKTYPAPWGPALGAVTAASVAAAGYAEVKKIQNTSYGGGGGVASATPSVQSNVGVTPLDVRNDIQPSPSMLPNSQNPQDTRVYILQSDLEASRRQVEIRENNSTF